MGLTYFKRFQMEISLRRFSADFPALPSAYRLLPWTFDLLEEHAEAKFRSFAGEIDACVFPCLGELEGCSRLMRDIVSRDGFLPRATWLACSWSNGDQMPCGTVQGMRVGPGRGSIQNLGVVPDHRGHGLGTALLMHALVGFQESGMRRVSLEVTAENQAAVRLYQTIGFRTVRTLYKAVEVAYS